MWVGGYLDTFVVVGVLGVGVGCACGLSGLRGVSCGGLCVGLCNMVLVGVWLSLWVCAVCAVLLVLVCLCWVWFWRCVFWLFDLWVGLGFLAPGLVLGCASFCCAAWVFVLRVSCA